MKKNSWYDPGPFPIPFPDFPERPWDPDDGGEESI